MRASRVWPALLVLAGGLFSCEARAESAASTSKDLRNGDRAVARHDYRRAAEAYESAYESARTLATLAKAAHAWTQAGERARAANLIADYLATAPPDAPHRAKTDKALRNLASHLGRLEIAAPDVDRLLLDGMPLDKRTVYVEVGTHDIEGQGRDRRTVREQATVAAGETVNVTLTSASSEETAPPRVPPPTASASASSPSTASSRPSPQGWSPLVVVAGSAVTAGLLGLTIWSGLDTEAFKESFDREQTRDNLDTGNGKQLRTNLLLGGTIASAAFTGIAAGFLVDWRRSQKEVPKATGPRLVVGVNSAYLTGTF